MPETLPSPRTPALGKIPEATGACFPRRLRVGMLSPFMTVISREKNQVTMQRDPGGTQLYVSVEAGFCELEFKMSFNANES